MIVQVLKSQRLLTRHMKFGFSKFDYLGLGTVDCSNVLEAIKPPSSEIATDLITKFSVLSPSHVYATLDESSRELLLYLANDCSWGMGCAILGISMAIKIIFGPIMYSAQFNGMRMKLIEPETKNYQNLMQRLSRSQDYAAVKAAKKQYSVFRRKHKISMLIPMLAILQVPILMTWFFSLRYVTSLPDSFPGLTTQGFLWFKDLSTYDPYGILPVLSALATFWNMSLNPNMQSSQSAPFAKYFRYARFLPFFSIPVVIFFPSGLNLYWFSSALFHLAIASSARSNWMRKFIGIPQYLPGTILERLNQQSTQTIIKGVIDKNINAQQLHKEIDGSTKSPTQTSSQQQQPQQQQQVKIFSAKPKKKL